jgi:hypothetical protein
MLSLRAVRLYRRDLRGWGDARKAKKAVTFWLLVCLAMVLLGINRQFDLISLLTEVGRDIARVQGWYDHRQTVQAYGLLGLASTGCAGMLIVCIWFRHIVRRILGALIGVSFLAAPAAIRAVSLHQVDQWLGRAPVALNGLLELSGVLLVAFSAWRQDRQAYHKAPSPGAAPFHAVVSSAER